MKETIAHQFPINNQEYLELEKAFVNLCRYASWQLIKKNAKNNYTDEFEDINQELLMSIIRAGSYYKRQIYIEQCFVVVNEFVRDEFILFVLHELENLWHNRTRHGASRQKFGIYQEMLLERIVQQIVSKGCRPNKEQLLRIDAKFSTYAKAIVWNAQKSMGRKITREKDIRHNLASISEFDYLATI